MGRGFHEPDNLLIQTVIMHVFEHLYRVIGCLGELVDADTVGDDFRYIVELDHQVDNDVLGYIDMINKRFDSLTMTFTLYTCANRQVKPYQSGPMIQLITQLLTRTGN
ncbi:hypothetical protein, partial [Thiohalophilus sp.]|uniref:hypothetical protein n=1 Tax=Thiohalophilus sp. TaxID=3028392 RepID=UPI003975CFA1